MDESIFYNSFWYGANCLSLSIEPNRQDAHKGNKNRKSSGHTMSDSKNKFESQSRGIEDDELWARW